MSDESTEKKIIIDEDWKSKVQAEREQFKQQPPDAGDEPTPQASDIPIPPASFQFLITSLATQAMMALGQIPDPIDNKTVVHLDLAKHHIDMLAVIEEKTKGNLSQDEDQMLEALLHQLRVGFVAAKGHG